MGPKKKIFKQGVNAQRDKKNRSRYISSLSSAGGSYFNKIESLSRSLLSSYGSLTSGIASLAFEASDPGRVQRLRNRQTDFNKIFREYNKSSQNGAFNAVLLKLYDQMKSDNSNELLTLNFSDIELTSFPDCFRNTAFLDGIRFLDLKHNTGLEVSPDIRMGNLETLIWSNVNKNTQWIFSIVSLQNLNISNNGLVSIDGIGALTNLSLLDISQNMLSTLDSAHFQHLTKLEELRAIKCMSHQLTRGANIDGLKQLADRSTHPNFKRLFISENNLSAIPKEISGMKDSLGQGCYDDSNNPCTISHDEDSDNFELPAASATTNSTDEDLNLNIVILGGLKSGKKSIADALRCYYRNSPNAPRIWDVANLSAHSIFFAPRTIYLIAWNMDNTDSSCSSDAQIRYWIDFIHMNISQGVSNHKAIAIIVGTTAKTLSATIRNREDSIKASIIEKIKELGKGASFKEFLENRRKLKILNSNEEFLIDFHMSRLKCHDRLKLYSVEYLRMADIEEFKISKADSDSPSHHGFQSPSNHGFQSPSNHGFQSPSNHGFQSPSHHGIQSPSQSFHLPPRNPQSSSFRHKETLLTPTSKYNNNFRNSQSDMQFQFEDDEEIGPIQADTKSPEIYDNDNSLDPIEKFSLGVHRIFETAIENPNFEWSDPPEADASVDSKSFDDALSEVKKKKIPFFLLEDFYDIIAKQMDKSTADTPDYEEFKDKVDAMLNLHWIKSGRLFVFEKFKSSYAYGGCDFTGDLTVVVEPAWLSECLASISNPRSFYLDKQSSFVPWYAIESLLKLNDSESPWYDAELNDEDGVRFKLLRLVLEELNVIIPINYNKTTCAIEEDYQDISQEGGDTYNSSDTGDYSSDNIEEIIEEDFHWFSKLDDILPDLDANDEFLLPNLLSDKDLKRFNSYPKSGSIVLEQIFCFETPATFLRVLPYYLIPRVLTYTYQVFRENSVEHIVLQKCWKDAFVLEVDSLILTVVLETPGIGENCLRIRALGEGPILSAQNILSMLDQVSQAISMADLKPKRYHTCPLCLMRQKNRNECGTIDFEDVGAMSQSQEELDVTFKTCLSCLSPIRFDFLATIPPDKFVQMFPNYAESVLSYIQSVIRAQPGYAGMPSAAASGSVITSQHFVPLRASPNDWQRSIGCIVTCNPSSNQLYLLATELNLGPFMKDSIWLARMPEKNFEGITLLSGVLDSNPYQLFAAISLFEISPSSSAAAGLHLTPLCLRSQTSELKIKNADLIGKTLQCWSVCGEVVSPTWARVICAIPSDNLTRGDIFPVRCKSHYYNYLSNIIVAKTNGGCQYGSPVTNEKNEVIGMVLRDFKFGEKADPFLVPADRSYFTNVYYIGIFSVQSFFP